MRFIKLTEHEIPIWVNIDRIVAVVECKDSTLSMGAKIFVSGIDEFVLVDETPDEIISKCEAQGR